MDIVPHFYYIVTCHVSRSRDAHKYPAAPSERNGGGAADGYVVHVRRIKGLIGGINGPLDILRG